MNYDDYIPIQKSLTVSLEGKVYITLELRIKKSGNKYKLFFIDLAPTSGYSQTLTIAEDDKHRIKGIEEKFQLLLTFKQFKEFIENERTYTI